MRSLYQKQNFQIKNLNAFIKQSDYFVTCIGSEYGKARYLISKELEKN